MLWHDFEENSNCLLNQYRISHWNESSGETPAELQMACDHLEQEMAGQPLNLIRARHLAYILTHGQLEIIPCEWMADKINHGNIMMGFRQKWKAEIEKGEMRILLEETAGGVAARAYSGNEDFGHTTPDWATILRLGFPGILQRIIDARTTRTAEGNLSSEQKDFYDSCEITYRAVITYIHRLAAEADRLAAQYPKQAIVAQNLDNLTQRAPATMMEALQFIILIFILQSEIDAVYLRSLGGLDRLLFPYYRQDLASGKITKEQVVELLKYFMTKLRAKHHGANIPFYLGGVDSDGQDVTNELSYLIVDTYHNMAVFDPKIQIRVHDNTPADFLRAVFRSIRDGCNSFVFINDPIAISALLNIGISLRDARNYALIGCYEPCALGKEIPCTCNGIISLPKAVEIAINDGIDPLTGERVGLSTGPADQLLTFDDLFKAVKAQLGYFADRSIERITAYESHYRQICLSPLYSATLDECVENGLDAYAGSAKYNNSSINAIGLAAAVDALIAVKKVVYEEKLISLADFSAILQANWEGAESLRLRCKNRYPKYGNGLDEVDLLTCELAAHACSCINNRPNDRGGKFRCGLFSIDWYIDFGSRTGATPDGRLAHEPLSKNLCAMIARDKAGITALINSVTRIDYTLVPNGSVLDVMLHPSSVQGENGLDILLDILAVYRQKGGFGIHFNIIDVKTLKAAQKNPDQYATLQVRVCGWNAYFVNLSLLEQDEFIRNAEHVKA